MTTLLAEASMPHFSKEDLASLMRLGGMSTLTPEPPGLTAEKQAQWLMFQGIKSRYPWLEYEVERSFPFCALCRKYGKSSCGFTQLKLDVIAEHAWTPSHRESEKCITQEWLSSLNNQELADNNAGVESLRSDSSDRENVLREEADEGDHEDVESAESLDITGSSSEGDRSYDKQRRKFCHHWFSLFPWLIYDQVTQKMFCRICLKFASNTTTSFVAGSSSFKKCTLKAHDVCEIHRNALYWARKCDPDLAQMGGFYASQPLFDMPPVSINTSLSSGQDSSLNSSTNSNESHSYSRELLHQLAVSYLGSTFPGTDIAGRFIMAQPKSPGTVDVGYHDNNGNRLHFNPANLSKNNISAQSCISEKSKQETCPESVSVAGEAVLLYGKGEVKQEKTETESPADITDERSSDADDGFKPEWLDLFKWLIYDDINHLLYCKACILVHSGADNDFANGCKEINISVITNHAVSASHMEAVEGTMSQVMEAERLREEGGTSEEEDVDDVEGEHLTPAESPPAAADTEEEPVKRLTPVKVTSKERFLVKKYLQFFPWLLYNEQVNVLVCDICQRHNVNLLYLEVSTELEYRQLRAHMETNRHRQAEDAEVSSWHMMWDQDDEELTPDSDDIMTTDPTIKERWIHSGLENISASSNFSHKLTSTPRNASSSLSSPPTGTSPISSALTPKCGFAGMTAEASFHLQQAMGEHIANLTPLDLPTQETYTAIVHGAKKSSYVPKKNNIIPAFGKFKAIWLYEFPWLIYDQNKNIMKCMYCMRHGKKTTFSRGVRIFSRSCILYHSRTAKHVDAVRKEGIEVDEDTLKKMKSRKNSVYRTLVKKYVKPMGERAAEMADDNIVVKTELESDHGDEPVSVDENSMSEVHVKTEPVEEEETALATTVLEASSTSQSHEKEEKKTSPDKTRERKFLKHWLTLFPWLIYEDEDNIMFCRLCLKHRPGSMGTFVRGSRTFRITSIQVHALCREHQLADRMERLASAHLESSSAAPMETE